MRDAATIPLFPEALPFLPASPASRPALRKGDLERMRQRGDVVVRKLPTRELLNRCDNPRMPFVWTINPYRGCDLACSYCYARPTHEYLGYDRADVYASFEREIWAKVGGEASLSPKKLAQAALEGPIAIGTATDPYQDAERSTQVTRRILERFLDVSGASLSITTKSPLVTRDLDLLRAIAGRNDLCVHVSISSIDDSVARRLEPRAATAARRLETMRDLSVAGIDVCLNLMPIVPSLTDSESSIRSTLAAARSHGARRAVSNPMFIPSGWRREGWDWLIARFPDHAASFERHRDNPRAYETERDAMQARAQRLICELGMNQHAS